MIKKLFVPILFLTACQSAQKNNCQHDDKSLNCVSFVKNYDADTVTVNVPGVHPLMGKKVSVRVLGVDTPEIRGKTTCEKEFAKVARDQVNIWLTQAKKINLTNVQRGKYFRIVADVNFDNQSLSEKLLRTGFAYPYDGGTKRNVNWCVSLKKYKADRLPATRSKK